MPNYQITIIGAGVMGKIFLAGAVRAYPTARISIADRNLLNLKKLQKTYRRVNVGANVASMIKNSDLVIIAVKPQSFDELAGEIRGRIGKSTTILSIMAGVSIFKIKKLIGTKKVVRSMPNLGARVGKSMTVWTTTKEVGADHRKLIQKLFGAIGQEMYVNNEILIDKSTAVSGSGPGFFFNMVDKWIMAAIKLGFTPKQAKKLVVATVSAGNTLLQSGDDSAELVKQVASKGGTTEAGLRVMNKSDMMKIWSKILDAAYKRARQLSK